LASIPHDLAAEEAVIAACLNRPDKVADLAAELAPEDFYRPVFQGVYEGFLDLYGVEGIKPDPVSLSHAAAVHGAAIDPIDLLSLQANSVSLTAKHVEIVRTTKLAREVLGVCREALQSVTDNGDPYEAVEDLGTFIRNIGTTSKEPTATTIARMMESAEGAAPWVIPGITRRDMRTVIVGFEGSGKGTLMRTAAMCVAQGRHPFRDGKIEPQRSMILDAENPVHAILDTAATLRNTLMRVERENYDEERFKIWHQLGGVNLRKRSHRADFQREIAAHRPTFVAIGPLYKLYSRKPGEAYEQAAEEVLAILDEMRTKYGFALWVEHHSPKQTGGKRELIPMGSQLLQAWPDLGIGLRPDVDDQTLLSVEHFRGARTPVDWPISLVRHPAWLFRGVYRLASEERGAFCDNVA
jgi:hypothetical protein